MAFRLDPGSFEVNDRFASASEAVARGFRRHLAITTAERRRCPLPDPIAHWLKASALGAGTRPL